MIPDENVDRPVGYAAASVHVAMLRDRERTHAYRQAIERNVAGKTVLEVGAGSGILSCFAARAGARHVYAVERTAIIEVAKAIAAANGLEDRITFIHADLRDVVLPEQVDVVLAELIGTDPLAEGLRQLHAEAAERHLRAKGISIPASLQIYALGVDSATLRQQLAHTKQDLESAGELSDEYGLDLSALTDAYSREFWQSYGSESLFVDLGAQAEVSDSPIDRIITDVALVDEFDLAQRRQPDPVWRRSVVLTAQSAGAINAVATYWSARLDEATELTTAPVGPNRTHWGGQMVTPITERTVNPGEMLRLEASFDLLRPSARRWDWRE